MTEPYLIIRELIREIRAEHPYYQNRGLIEDLLDFSLRCDLENPNDYYSVQLASRMEKLVGDFELKRNHPVSERLMTKIVQTYHDLFWKYSRYDAIFGNLPGGKNLRFPEVERIGIAENIRRRYFIRDAGHRIVIGPSIHRAGTIFAKNIRGLAQELKAIAYFPQSYAFDIILYFEDEHDLVLARLSI